MVWFSSSKIKWGVGVFNNHNWLLYLESNVKAWWGQRRGQTRGHAAGAQKPHSVVRGETLKGGRCLRIPLPKKSFRCPKVAACKVSILPIDPPTTEMFHDHIVNSGGVKGEPSLSSNLQRHGLQAVFSLHYQGIHSSRDPFFLETSFADIFFKVDVVEFNLNLL